MKKRTLLGGLLALSAFAVLGRDLEAVQQAGVLRHLGVPYANFVTGTRLSGENDGFDVELMQAFAQSLGVRYEFKAATWESLIPMLTGDEVRLEGARATVVGKTRVEGDVAASGITVLAWRQGLVAFSEPEFPTQVWLISHSDSDLKPIQPAGIETDILEVKKLLKGRSLYCKEKTCLDPSLYELDRTGARCFPFPGSLNELAPAIINKEKELTLLDVPDTLVALAKWPGQIKVIGPINQPQNMAVAFDKQSPHLRQAFNGFLAKSIENGLHQRLVEKYYPFVFEYFPDFEPFKKRPRPATPSR